jgi:hypothetical protein
MPLMSDKNQSKCYGCYQSSNSLILCHETAVPNCIGAKNSGELAFKTFVCHNDTPFFKVSSRSIQYVDYSKEHKSNQESDSIQLMENRFRSVGIGKSKQSSMNLYPFRWDLVKHKRNNRQMVIY